MFLRTLAKKVEMSEEEVKLFEDILTLVKQKEEGMFESVISEVDRKINEVVNNDSK